MTLNDIFTQLAHGELSQVILGNDGNSLLSVPEDRRKQVASHIQLGLTALYTRFRLREGSLLVRVTPDVRAYILSADYATSNTESEVLTENRYIQDSVAAPFQNDLLKVERVYARSSVGHFNELDANKPDNPSAVTLTEFNSLVLPDTLKTDLLKVIYRGDHPPFDVHRVIPAPQLISVYIPPSYLQALLYFVASRALNPVGMVAEFHEGNGYMQKFEVECARLEQLNYSLDQEHGDGRFERNGWV